MNKLVFDLECNGLDPTKIWVIAARDATTGKEWMFSDHEVSLPDLLEFRELFDSYDELIGHNIIKFDLPILSKLTGWKPREDQLITDTLIYSKLNNFIRPETNRRHSLGLWGEHFGIPKPEQEQWEVYEGAMLSRCREDVRINEKVYHTVIAEADDISEKWDVYRKALSVEHELHKISKEQEIVGWQFDSEGLEALLRKIYSETEEIEERTNPLLGSITKIIDKVPKVPKYSKDGCYTAVTARILSEFLERPINKGDALLDSPPIQPGTPFQRKTVTPATLRNMETVKEYLTSVGWKPLEWNWKKLGRQFIKVSPKFCTKSLHALGPIGVDVDMFYTLRARASILEGWREAIHGGRIRGSANDMGAATFRQTHRVIANIPSGKATYGKEIRSLFKASPGKILVSADSAACQLRILAHYMKDPEFTKEVLEGDLHQKNANVLGCTRNDAKGFIFAFLYGAGGEKLGRMIGVSKSDGFKAKENFLKAYPKLNTLIEKVQQVWSNNNYHNGVGSIRGIDGRTIYPEKAFSALNYLIQSCEAIIMKSTYVKAITDIRAEGIEVTPLLFYHDEFTVECFPEDSDRISEIIRQAFSEAPKDYGIDIMEAGDVKVGSNYYEVH